MYTSPRESVVVIYTMLSQIALGSYIVTTGIDTPTSRSPLSKRKYRIDQLEEERKLHEHPTID